MVVPSSDVEFATLSVLAGVLKIILVLLGLLVPLNFEYDENVSAHKLIIILFV